MHVYFLYLVIYTASSNATCPLYDSTKSFEENCKQGPHLTCTMPQRQRAPQSEWQMLLDYRVASPIGMPACAIMTSKGIAWMARLGFDVFTYKTVCSKKIISYELPNLCYVACDRQITHDDIGTTFYATDRLPDQTTTLAVSNSLGNPCDDWNWISHDIAQARASLHEGQILIVSVFGLGADQDAIAHDFGRTAQMAYKAGAHCIELNFSCPNHIHGLLYKNSTMVHAIVKHVYESVPIPIIIKVGVFDSKEQMRTIFHQAADAGARGVCGINTVPVHIIGHDGKPFFGAHRSISGLSGAPIRTLAHTFIRDAVAIIKEDALNLIILGTGGITSPEHFQEFLDLGATVALSGTGAMWNPYLAMMYHDKQSWEL